MAETGAVAAGEMSGHMFFADRWYGFDDAVFAAARLGYIISNQKRKNPDFKISDVLKPFSSVCTSPEIRYPCSDELKKPVLQKLEKTIIANPGLFGDTIKEIIKLDGLRIVFDGGFAMIRQSNTEPVFTLRFEGKTQKVCDGYRDTLIYQLEKICTEMKV
jgi:phosphomannomutase